MLQQIGEAASQQFSRTTLQPRLAAMHGALSMAAAEAAGGGGGGGGKSQKLAGTTRVRLLSEVMDAMDDAGHHDGELVVLSCLRCSLAQLSICMS